MADSLERTVRAAVQARWPQASNIVIVSVEALDERHPPRVRACKVTWTSGNLSHVEQFVVKFRPGASVEAEEVSLIQALSGTGLPVPVVRHSEMDELGSSLVTEMLPGQPMNRLLRSAGMRWELSALAFTFARMLARIHALDWSAIVPWMADPESLPEDIVADQVDQMWRDWEEQMARAPQSLQSLCNRALDWLEIRRPVDVSLCLNHGSYTPENVLLQDDDVSGVLDWDHAWVTDASFDLALIPFEIQRLGLPADDAALFLQAAFGAYLQSSPRSFGNLPFFTGARLLSAVLSAAESDDRGGTDGRLATASLDELVAALERTLTTGGKLPWQA